MQTASADGDTRTLSLHNTHTNESVTVTFKVNGRYDEEALRKINNVLRDFRENAPTTMDPHLIDLIWEVYREAEATEPIQIVCGYRSPQTNEMLRRRSNGVAKFSQHMLGKAMDFFIPGVPLDKLREIGLRAQRGGVGFYPSSNFVHMDTGSVRHWPRMPDVQLAKVIAKGPLTRFASKDRGTQVAAATKSTNPLARLFSGAEEEDPEVASVAPARVAAARTETARAERPAAVPLPTAKPAARFETAKVEPKLDASPVQGFGLASADSRTVQLPATPPAGAMGQVAMGQLASNGFVSANANDVISARGFWQNQPETEPRQTPAKSAALAPAKRNGAADGTPADRIAKGSLVPWPVGSTETTAREPSTEPALAYAPPTAAPGSRTTTGSVGARPNQRDTTVASKRSGSQPTLLSSAAGELAGPAKAGQRFNDPWMRAMILSPSAGGFMNTSILGAPDYRALGPYLQKPTTSVMMTFSDDPHLGMSTKKFSGSAVVFVSTVTFYQRTAAIR